MKLTIKSVPPVTPKEYERNVNHAKRLGFPRVGKAQTPRLAVVGGGPSIKDRIDELKAFDGDIWAVNGAFQWCRENGIDAWFFSIDPTELIVKHCKGARRAMVAMECHPNTFKALANAKVEAVSIADHPHWTTSATIAPSVGMTRGYTEFYFYGCEGSFGQDSHAYGNAQLDMRMRVKCNGEEFITTPYMMSQTDFLGDIIREAPHVFKERSGGLLAACVQSADIDVIAATEAVHRAIDDSRRSDRGSPPDGRGGADERAIPRLALKRPKVTGILICVPAGGSMVSSKTTESLFALGQFLTQQGINNQLCLFSAADIEDIRNLFVSVWYDTKPEFSHLLFVDADMGFHPMLIRDMIRFNEPLMGCLYARRQMTPSVVGTVEDGHSIKDVRNGFIKATGLGCGVMMISREVIANMLERMPELSDDQECHLLRAAEGSLSRIIRAFDKIREPKLRLSEDMAFCYRWQLCGGEVWANIDHRISHIGQFDYHMRYQGVLEGKAAQEREAA